MASKKTKISGREVGLQTGKREEKVIGLKVERVWCVMMGCGIRLPGIRDSGDAQR